MSRFNANSIGQSDQEDSEWNRSAQGRIFNQSTISFLKGDDDNKDCQNILSFDGNISERINNRSCDNSNFKERKGQIEGSFEIYLEKSPKKLEEASDNSKLILSKQSLDKNEEVLPTNMYINKLTNNEEKNKQQHNLEDHEVVPISIGSFVHQLYPEKISCEQNEKVNNDQPFFQQKNDKENQLYQNQELTLNTTNKVTHQSKIQDKIIRESIVNFERAIQIVNRALSKSMNRVQRINQYIHRFIHLLKIRKNNRKLPELLEKEYQLLGDASYYHLKQNQSKVLLKISNLIYYFTKLLNHLPLFLPTDTLRLYWDILLVIFTYSFFYMYSVLLFFANQEEDSNFIQQLFQYAFIIFLFDTLISFNSAFYDKDSVVSDRKQIAYKYLSSVYFFTDCISLFVMGSKVIFQNSNLVKNPDKSFSIFLINMLIFLKLYGVKEKRNRFSYAYALKENQKIVMRLFDQLLMVVVSAAHIVCVAWYSLGEYELQNGYSVSWLDKYGFNNSEYLEKYIYSLYWSITTMTTVGYGDISASNSKEALFITVAMILFSCVFAYSINNIGFILQEIEKSSKQLNNNITLIQRFLNRKNVNTALQSRVRHYLQFLAEKQRDGDQEQERSIINLLSNKLRDEITVEINKKILNKHSIFSANFSSQFLHKLVFIMKETLVSPNDIIFEEGDQDDQSIYFIEKGNIEIYQHSLNKNKTHLLQSLTVNQQFGEISFFSGLTRQASARSVNLSTLYKIKRNDFQNLIKENMEDLERFKMIEEQIRIQQDYSSIFIKCYSCNQDGHITQHCPNTHQFFDTQFKILKYNFTIFQDRSIYEKRKPKSSYPSHSLYLISENNNLCKRLKEDIRHFNSYTLMIFKTDQDLSSSNSDNSKNKLYNNDETFDSIETSIDNASTHQSGQHSEQTIFQRSLSQKGETKSSLKNIHKRHTQQLKKGIGTCNDINGSKDRESPDNRILTKKQSHLKSKGSFSTPISPTFEECDTNKIQSKTQIEQSEYAMNESLGRGGKDDTKTQTYQIMSHENIENINNSIKLPLYKHFSSSNQFHTKSKEELNMHVSDSNSTGVNNNSNNKDNNNINNNHINDNENENEYIKQQQQQRVQKKQRKPTQVTFYDQSRKYIENDDSGFNNYCSNERAAKSFARASICSSNNNKYRPSIDASLPILHQPGACHASNNNYSQGVINQIQKDLIQLEDKIQRFLISTQKHSIKNQDITKSNKRITKNYHCSQEFINQYGNNNELGINPYLFSDKHIHQKEKSLAAIMSSRNNISPQFESSPNQEHKLSQLNSNKQNSQSLLDKISNFFGIQQSIISGFLQLENGAILYEAENSTLIEDSFDRIQNFRRFFPHNNFNSIGQKLQQNKKISKNKTIYKMDTQQKRRNNFMLSSPKNHHFYYAIQQDCHVKNSYKPSFFSYGVSQKNQSVFPKNLIQYNMMISNEIQH